MIFIKMKLDLLGQHLNKLVPRFIQRTTLWKDELTLHTSPEHLRPLCLFLRDHYGTRFQQLVELTATDRPSDPNRFHLTYCLLSHFYRLRLQLQLVVPDLHPVPTVSDIFPSADWPEREVWDMYGISFQGHPDLRRILTDYGFEGHPLRKDFPLTGFVQVRWDGEKKRVVQEPVKLTQEYRKFELGSPWETLSKTPLFANQSEQQLPLEKK